MASPASRLARVAEQSRKLAELERVRLGAASNVRASCSLSREHADRVYREAQERSVLQHAKGLARLRSLYDELPGRVLPTSALTRLRDEETAWHSSQKALAAATGAAAADLQSAEAALMAAEAALARILRRNRRREAMAQRLAEDNRRAREMEDEMQGQDTVPS